MRSKEGGEKLRFPWYSAGHLPLLGDQVNCDIWRNESRAFNKVEIVITDTTKKNRSVYARRINRLLKNNKVETEAHPTSFLARYKKGFSKL